MFITVTLLLVIYARLTVANLSQYDALLYGNAFGVLGRNASYDYVGMKAILKHNKINLDKQR